MAENASDMSHAVIRLAAIGRIVIPLCHDISNPLAAILGRIQIQMARGSGGTTPEPSGLDDMYENALLISDKVQTLGSLAQEAAEAKDPRPTVLGDHVGEITALLGRNLDRRGLELRFCLPAAIPPVSVRPIDLKLLVAEVLLALGRAVNVPGLLHISAEAEKAAVRLIIAAGGIHAAAVLLPDESRYLRDLAADDGLVLSVGEAFVLSMPSASRHFPDQPCEPTPG